jgi:hypothetical protein
MYSSASQIFRAMRIARRSGKPAVFREDFPE